MAKGKGGGRKIGRDATTGEFIPVKEAEKKKSTSTVETLPAPKKGGGKGGKKK